MSPLIHGLFSVSNTFLHAPLINYAADEYPCSTTSNIPRYHLENTPIKDDALGRNQLKNAPLPALLASLAATGGQSLSSKNRFNDVRHQEKNEKKRNNFSKIVISHF
jgi:hypothetical protein